MAKKKTTARKGVKKTAASTTRGAASAPRPATRRAASKGRASSSRGAAPRAASGAAIDGERIRAKVREMTASTLRGEAPSPERVGLLFRDVMRGTLEAVDRAMPPSLRSDKLREAVDSFAGQFERMAHDARQAGEHAMAPVMRAARDASERPLAAMQESMRTGAHVASGAASRIMSATGGVFSGIADGIADAAERGKDATGARKPERRRK